MATDSGSNHNVILIYGLTMVAVSMSGTYRAEKTVFGKHPHLWYLLALLGIWFEVAVRDSCTSTLYHSNENLSR